MVSWSGFASSTEVLAASGRRLLGGVDGNPIAFLATVSPTGNPHLAPVCPIFSGDDLFLSVAQTGPKCGDLRATGRYTLHAFLGEHDEEFQISGGAALLQIPLEIATVHKDIPFTYQAQDPVFRLDIQRALWCFWEIVGQADTRPIRQRWRA
jgi:hypothetical protein